MASMNDLMARGNALAEKYDITTLKNALKNAIAQNDNEDFESPFFGTDDQVDHAVGRGDEEAVEIIA